VSDIRNEQCRALVQQYQVLASQDVRFDVPLADACHDDRATLCASVPPVRPRGARGWGAGGRSVPAWAGMARGRAEGEARRQQGVPQSERGARALGEALAAAVWGPPHVSGIPLGRLFYCSPPRPRPGPAAPAAPPPPQGSARVVRCLESHRAELSSACRATLFDEEVRFSENIDFQYPMKKACAEEIEAFCPKVPHGNARVIRCGRGPPDRRRRPAGAGLGAGSRALLGPLHRRACSSRAAPAIAALPFTRLFALGPAPQPTRPPLSLLPALPSPPLFSPPRCLQENKGKKDFGRPCLAEVLQYEQRASSDYRLNHRLRTACRDDVDALCKSACQRDTDQVGGRPGSSRGGCAAGEAARRLGAAAVPGLDGGRGASRGQSGRRAARVPVRAVQLCGSVRSARWGARRTEVCYGAPLLFSPGKAPPSRTPAQTPGLRRRRAALPYRQAARH
jgi:hypothetical protein